MELQVPQPPNELFKKDRTKGLLGERAPIYMLEKIECTLDNGIQVYRTGATYPEKGWPTPEAIYALNQVKKIIFEFMGLAKNPIIAIGLLLTNKTTLIKRFNAVFEKLFGTHTLKEEFFCPASRALYQFLKQALKDIGIDEEIGKQFAYNFAHLIEYDNAYRYRAQDMMTACNFSELQKNPQKEIKRLIKLWGIRESFDSRGVTWKMERLITPLLYLLYIPKYKKALINNAKILEGMKYDEGDWYWVCMRSEYEYGGISWEDRQVGLSRPQKYYANT